MSRIQLALNVADLDASVAFYTTLFGVEPHKRRPGYANFAVADPPLKLVLFEVDEADRGTGTAAALNHLGVEVFDSTDVTAAAGRLESAGLDTRTEEGTTCCHAVQDKVWVDDPSGAPWEFYVITDDNPTETDAAAVADESCCAPASGDSVCCGPVSVSA
jgi:catechol 2,3-dioxygenase-like lactoylglutathione lyase family enzyme